MNPDPAPPLTLSVSSAQARTVDDQAFVACGLALGAGLVHVGAAVDHFHHYLPHSLFFAVLAVSQVALSAALYMSKSSRLHLAACLSSISVAALWALSRTTGLPFGPTPWHAEPVGVLDALATADELMLAVLLGLSRRARRHPTSSATRRSTITVGVALILLTALALVGTEHTH